MLWCLLLCGLALAEPDVATPDDDLPSALDGLLSSDEPGRRLIRSEEGASKTTGAWFVWPLSLSTQYPHPGAEKNYRSNYLGVSVGRRWYSIGGGNGYSLEASASALFPLGPRTHGRMLTTSVLGGPRSRYLSLLAGPLLASNELHLDGAGGLESAAFAGGRLQLMSDLGPLTLMVGGEPVWRLIGNRDSADWTALSWPGFGDEMTWLAGVSVSVHRHWRVQAGERLWLSDLGAYHGLMFGVGIQ